MSNYIDCLPENNLEKKYFSEIAQNVTHNINIVAKNFDDDMPSVSGDKIILMNADESYRVPTEVDDPSVKMIFKQYCPQEYHEKLRPIPLGPSKDLVPSITPINERKYDVSFVGQVAGNRYDIYQQIPYFLNDPSINCFFGFYSGFNRGMSTKCYSEILSNTKVAICPHGTSSPETFRFFEAMSLSCVVIAPAMPDNWIYAQSPHQIIEGHIYQNIKEVLEKDLSSMANSSLNYYNKFVSANTVAEYIMKELHNV